MLGVAPCVVALRLDRAVDRQQLGRLGQRADRARADRGQDGRAEHGRVGAGRLDRHADRVGLELKQQRLVGEAAVHAQRAHVHALAHRGDHVRHAPGDPLQRRPRHVRPGGAAVQPGDHGARVRAPPGRPDAGQRRQHAGAGAVLGLAGELGQRGRPLGDAELAAHPLEHRAGGEHAAVDRVLRDAVDPPRHGRQQPAGRSRHLGARVPEHEHAGAVGRLDPSRHHAARPGQRRLLVDDLPAQRQLDRPRLVAQHAQLAGGLAHLGQHVERHAEQLAQARVEAGCAERVQLRARGGRGVGREARAEPVAEERVDGPHAQGAGVAGALHAVVVLEQPGELGGGEVGVEGQAAALLDLRLVLAQAVEHLLRALVLPDDDRGERRPGLGVPGEHRLALVVEPAGDHRLRRVGEQLADRLHDRGEHLLAVLLDPARLRVAVDLVAARLAHRPQLLVEQRRLDPGCPLVDPEQ